MKDKEEGGLANLRISPLSSLVWYLSEKIKESRPERKTDRPLCIFLCERYWCIACTPFKLNE